MTLVTMCNLSETFPEDVDESIWNTPDVLAGAGAHPGLHRGVDLRLELHDSPPGRALPLRLLGCSGFLPQIIHEASLDLPDPALVLRLGAGLQVDEEERPQHPERRVEEQQDQHLLAGNISLILSSVRIQRRRARLTWTPSEEHFVVLCCFVPTSLPLSAAQLI